MAARTVVVVGLGVVGLSTALALARRGEHVVGLDRLGSGHPHTSSTGLSRSIRVAYALPDYARLAVEALDRWTRLEEESGDRLLHLTGQLDVASPEVLADLAAGLRAAGAEYEELGASDMRRRMPGIVDRRRRVRPPPPARRCRARRPGDGRTRRGGRGRRRRAALARAGRLGDPGTPRRARHDGGGDD